MMHQRYLPTARLSTTMLGEVLLCQDHKTPSSPTSRSSSSTTTTTLAIKRVNMKRARAAWEQGATAENPAQEARTAIQIMKAGGHPNVLTFHHVFSERDHLHTVMEFCAGGDLHQYVERAPLNRLAEANALEIVRQLASGLGFLHGIGIAHRDLSLENVFLADDGAFKIADFGMSVAADQVCRNAAGKAYYMAPEVVARRPYDPMQADVWSLGVVLFILLTGSPLVELAWHKDAAFAALQEFGVRKILEAWKMDGLFSVSTIELLDQMLCVDPSKRLAVAEVVAHLAFNAH